MMKRSRSKEERKKIFLFGQSYKREREKGKVRNMQCCTKLEWYMQDLRKLGPNLPLDREENMSVLTYL